MEGVLTGIEAALNALVVAVEKLNETLQTKLESIDSEISYLAYSLDQKTKEK